MTSAWPLISAPYACWSVWYVCTVTFSPCWANSPSLTPTCSRAFSQPGTTATVICAPPSCAWPAAWPDEVPVPGTWQPVADNTNQADTRVRPDRRTIPPRPARALATTRPNEAPLIDRWLRLTGAHRQFLRNLVVPERS